MSGALRRLSGSRGDFRGFGRADAWVVTSAHVGVYEQTETPFFTATPAWKALMYSAFLRMLVGFEDVAHLQASRWDITVLSSPGMYNPPPPLAFLLLNPNTLNPCNL